MLPPLSAIALASPNPKPVISLINLITANLLAPQSVNTTVAVDASSAAAPAAGAAATATALGSTPPSLNQRFLLYLILSFL